MTVPYFGLPDDIFRNQGLITGRVKHVTRVPERVDWASLPERVRNRSMYQRDPSQLLYSNYRIDNDTAASAPLEVLATLADEARTRVLELREKTIISFIAMGVDAYAETYRTEVKDEIDFNTQKLSHEIRMLPLRRIGSDKYVAWDQSIKDWEQTMRREGVTYSVTDLPDIDTVARALKW